MEFLESFAYLLRATTDDMENIDKLQFLQIFSYLFSLQSSDKLLINPCSVFCIIKNIGSVRSEISKPPSDFQ